MFSSPIFLKSMKSTFLFVLYTVPASVIISLFLAVIANEKLKGIGFFEQYIPQRWEYLLQLHLYFGCIYLIHRWDS